MNYPKHYYNLVYSRQKLNRVKNSGIYYEKHHIKPKCFGGGNDKNNLVLLTAKEHFIAHLLLVEMHEGKEKAKMSFALFQMCRKNKVHGRLISAKQFEAAKLIMSKNCSGENGGFFGKTHSEEYKAKLKERMLKDNPAKGKPSWNKGKKLSPLTTEQKELLSQRMKEVCSTAEAKERLRQISINQVRKPRSEETRKKISESLKKRKLLK